MEFSDNSIFTSNKNKKNSNFEMDPSVYVKNNIDKKTFNFSKLNKNSNVNDLVFDVDNANSVLDNKNNNKEFNINDKEVLFKIDRLNYLYFQSKSPNGLTQAELEEQGLLREYFIKYFKQNIKY